MMTYSEARSLMASARNPGNGKPLGNNTRLYARVYGGKVHYAVKLHSTDVVEIHANGTYVLSTGGWDTPTTWSRINQFGPRAWANRSTIDGGKCWRIVERADDPEPPFPSREIPKPYNVADPGPEPVKPTHGCIAGTKATRVETMSSYHNWDGLTDAERATAEPQSHRSAPTRARDVLSFIAANDNAYTSHRVVRDETIVTHWYAELRETYSHLYASEGIGVRPPERKLCPHCDAFSKLHAAWKSKMHGGWGHRYPYRVMRENLDRYGSREAWQEAYITEFREVRAARTLYKEWMLRNYVPMRGSITVNTEGLVPRSVADAHFKMIRAENRRIRQREREHEARMRHAAQVERFKRSVQRRRPRPFEKIAGDVAQTLHTLATELESVDA